MNPFRRPALAALAAALLAGAILVRPACADPPTSEEGESPRLVLLFSWDGLRPDAIEKAPAPHLMRLIREGAYCPTAQTIFPSATLPAHTSMITGLTVEKHRVLWNDYIPLLRIRHKTVLDLAWEAGMECAIAAGKRKFYHFHEDRKLETYIGEKPDGQGHWPAKNLVDPILDYLKAKRPRLLFIHFRDPDSAGHRHGWMGEEQMAAIRSADEALARILAAIDEDDHYRGRTTVIVTSDHGGQGKTHGSLSKEDMTIPWVAWGFGVAPGKTLTARIRTYDTAATVAYLLGLDIPENWDGKPVLTALFAPKK